MLNEISDNLVGHDRKSAKTKRLLIGTIARATRCVRCVRLAGSVERAWCADLR